MVTDTLFERQNLRAFLAGVIFGVSHLMAFSESAFGLSIFKSGVDAVFNNFKRSSMDADSLKRAR